MVEERGIRLALEPEEAPTRSSEVFYNPAMRADRDISTAVLSVYARRARGDLYVGDVLAGSGIRGLRYAREVPGVDRVVFNDANPAAATRIREHLVLNRCPPDRFQVETQSANAMMAIFSGHFQALDVDPYGSFIPFLDAAVQSIRRDGLLGLVATDLAPAFGVYPRTCLRRYGARSERTSFSYELMLRIYLKAVVEACARHDRVWIPWVTFYQRHHVRLMGVVRNDAEAAVLQMTRMGYVWRCRSCDWRELQGDPGETPWSRRWPLPLTERVDGCPHCGEAVHPIGPLWLGETAQPEVVAESLDWLRQRDYREAARLLERLEGELPIRTPYYDTHALAQRLQSDPPNLTRLAVRLQQAGFQAARSHCQPQGIKTDAPLACVIETLRAIAGR